MRLLLAFILVVSWTGRLHAQWEEMLSLAGRMPGDVELVVVVDDAASMRAAPVGRYATDMLEQSGLVLETVSAWEELAASLKIGRAAAFDRLLGRRVMFVASNVGTGRTSWTLISEVDTKTLMLLRARLQPVPRRRIAGRPIYALENGRFLLASVTRDKHKGNRAFILLAPSADADLFERLLIRLTESPPRLRPADDEAFAALQELPPGRALVLWRTETGLGDRLWDETRYMVASLDVDGETIGATMRGSAGLIWGPDDCCDGYPMWPSEQADKLVGDALFVDIGLIGGAKDPIVRWLRDVAAAGMFHDVIEELSPYLGHRAALIVRKSTGGSDVPSLAVEVVTEVNDLSRATRAGDRALAGVIARITSSPAKRGEGPPEETPEIIVELPGAVRTASLGGFGNGLFGRAPAAAWTYQVDPLGEKLASMGEPQGWLVLRIGESGSNIKAVRRLRDLLGREFDPELDPRVSQGLVRPSQLLDVLGANGFLLPPPLDLAERIETIEWSASLDGETVIGRVIVRLGPPRDQR